MDSIRKAVELADQGQKFCLAVVVGKSGSAPQIPGAKGLFLSDGRIVGTIGGGCLEMEARRQGLQAMATNRPILSEFKLDDDFGWDDGLICGGRVQVLLLPDTRAYIEAYREAISTTNPASIVYELSSGRAQLFDGDSTREEVRSAVETRRAILTDQEFIEPVLRNETLYVFGGGHIGAQLARFASELDFDVTIIDDRAEMVSEARVPWAKHRVAMKPDEFVASVAPSRAAYVCIVTRGHRNDAKVLKQLIRNEWAYLGMIGSRRKREVVKGELIAEGLCSEEQFERVKSPMGVPIGAESVNEIAISIVADLLRVRSELRGPIRARCKTISARVAARSPG